jgi:hypothetical protein
MVTAAAAPLVVVSAWVPMHLWVEPEPMSTDVAAGS